MSEVNEKSLDYEVIKEKWVEESIKDPLSEITRKERKFLLGISLLGFAVSHAGIVPSKILALGVDFSAEDRQALMRVLILIVVYFIAAFITYASSDFISWRIRFYKAFRVYLKAPIPDNAEVDQVVLSGLSKMRNGVYKFKNPSSRFSGRFAVFVVFARCFVEFLLPVVFSSYVVYLLANISI